MAKRLRRDTRRCLGLLLAAVTMLAPALSALHAARARHVTCAEHGDLVEAGETKAELAHSDAAGPVALPSEGDAGGHQHDHCALAAQARSALSVPVSGARAAPETAVAIVLPAAEPRPAAAVPLYLLAPKSSPPA